MEEKQNVLGKGKNISENYKGKRGNWNNFLNLKSSFKNSPRLWQVNIRHRQLCKSNQNMICPSVFLSVFSCPTVVCVGLYYNFMNLICWNRIFVICKVFSFFYITKIMGAKYMKKSPSTSTAIFCGFMVGNMRSQKLLQEIFISWFLFLECTVNLLVN